MNEQRFYITDTGLGLDTESDEMYSFGDEEDFYRLFDKLNEQQDIINKLRKELASVCVEQSLLCDELEILKRMVADE